MSDSGVEIDQGKAGIYVDSVAVTTNSGARERQRVAVADAVNPEYNWVINADGSASVSGNVGVSGSVSVLNPTTNVSASVNVTVASVTVASVSVLNAPFGVYQVGNWGASVSNFPVNQTVSGSVSVLNQVASVTVQGAVNANVTAGSVSAIQDGYWAVGTQSSALNIGQSSASTAAIQIHPGSIVMTNSIMIGAISTNTSSVFIGGSTVALSGSTGGVELTPGASQPFTCGNINQLYIIGSNNTDTVWWNVT